MENMHIPEMVDLGLPSGLKWAKWNIGASKETDSGLYFKYGEAEGHAPSDSDILDAAVPAEFADAATAAYGDGYRMPTREDFIELRRCTNRSVETINGVKGRKFVNKNDSSKYIFIPFKGFYYGNSLHFDDCYGFLWTSTPVSPYIAFHLHCGESGGAGINGFFRNHGFPVRAVSK